MSKSLERIERETVLALCTATYLVTNKRIPSRYNLNLKRFERSYLKMWPYGTLGVSDLVTSVPRLRKTHFGI